MLDVINDNDKIIVATSGGTDSMYLLNELVKLKDKMKLALVVAHVNHQTRVECDLEEAFVEHFCGTHGLVFECVKINSYDKGHFTEEEAREKRIAFFTMLIKKYNYDYVVTAHHANDLMETILMKLMRGSTLDAIVGIKPIETIGGVVFKRPLLNLTKQQILEELEKNNWDYKIDYTNYHEEHLRNRLRKNVVPLMEKEVGNVESKFFKFSRELNALVEYLNDKLDIIDKELKNGEDYDLEKFNKLDDFLKKEYLKKILKQIMQNDVKKLNVKSYDRIINFLLKRKKNRLELTKEYNLEVGKNCFRIVKALPISKDDKQLVCTDLVKLNDGILVKTDCFGSKSNYEIHLSSKDVVLPLYIIHRKLGMVMEVKNLGHKKVKDILIDEHVLPSKKDEVLIMIDSAGKVLWLLGLKKSKYDLDNYEKCDIIYKYERKEL